MASDFLMQQMQWREQLEEAEKPAELEVLKLEMRTARELALAACENAIDLQADWPQAVECVRRLMFMQRFEQDIDRRLDQMDL
jgi:molecular chaperone HscB